MSRRHRQLRVRNPDVFLLLPATPLAHRHARILRTLPVDHTISCFRYPDLHHGLLGMFLNRSPIVCVRRKLRVWDGTLEAAPTRPNPEWAIKKSGSALCKTTTRTLSSASSSLPSLSNSCDRSSSRRFIGG